MFHRKNNILYDWVYHIYIIGVPLIFATLIAFYAFTEYEYRLRDIDEVIEGRNIVVTISEHSFYGFVADTNELTLRGERRYEVFVFGRNMFLPRYALHVHSYTTHADHMLQYRVFTSGWRSFSLNFDESEGLAVVYTSFRLGRFIAMIGIVLSYTGVAIMSLKPKKHTSTPTK